MVGAAAGTQQSCTLAPRNAIRLIHSQSLACKGSKRTTRSSELPDQVTRRQSLLFNASLASVLLGQWINTPLAVQAKVEATLAVPACTEKLDGPLAAAFLQSLYEAILEMKVMEPQQFQVENFKLRDREWPYYQAAMRDRLSVLPDLTDQTGGLSEPLYFNFVSYCAWKVAARHVVTAAQRTQLCQVAGNALLQRVWPEGVDTAAAAAATGMQGKAGEDATIQLIENLFTKLQTSGYCCRHQIVWGEQPGGWPQDWMVSQPSVTGSSPAAGLPIPAGFTFQVKVHRPADIEGSIAMRSEEDGFWSQSEVTTISERSPLRPSLSLGFGLLLLMSVVSSMLKVLLEAAGYSAAADEYFYQDAWQGPRSLTDQMLLFLGDPMQVVGVDFVPSTLVQNWEFR